MDKLFGMLTVVGCLMVCGGAPLAITQGSQYFRSQETYQWILASMGVMSMVFGFLFLLLTMLYALKNEHEIALLRLHDEAHDQ